MKTIRVLAARVLRIGAPLLMLAIISADGAPNSKKYVLLSALVEGNQTVNGPGTDQTTVITNNYDRQGNLLDTLIVNSGIFAQVQTTTFTNNNSGDPTTSVVEVNNDGLADPDGPDDIDLTAISTFTYDNQGKRVAIDQEVYNDDDQLTIVRLTSLTYDAQGNLTLIETDSDVADLIGVFDGIADQIITVENTWDANGRLLQTVTHADLNGNGDTVDQGDSVETRVNTFDANGRVASALITTVRMNNSQVISSTATATFTYDKRGLLTEIQTTLDTANDGISDFVNTTINTWGKK